MHDSPRISYGQLRSILGELGYAQDLERSGRKHVTFAHSGPGMILILPVYSDRAAVQALDMATVQAILKQALPEEVETFDRLVRETAERKPGGVSVS